MTAPGFTLRVMTPVDAPVLARLEAEVEETPWSEGNFLDSLASGHLCRVLEAPDGEIAAWAVVMTVLDESELLIIGVARALQRRGLGRELLEAVTADVRARGAVVMHLEVRAGNVPALALYERAGFARTGLRRGYYRTAAGREDAVLMSRPLVS